MTRGRSAVIGVPYLWLLVFFLLPFLVVLKISVSEMDVATFKDLLAWKDGASPSTFISATMRCWCRTISISRPTSRA
jgi:ABC-type spermidine/putrescine transport system permease subunit I